MTKVLVTGVNGFVGHHVAHKLYEKGVSIIGLGNQPVATEELRDILDEYIGLDLTSPAEVERIPLTQIDAIINLAGFAKVGESRGQGELYNRVNVEVHTVLYEACLMQGAAPRIIAVSTGAVYDSSQPMPITESSALVADNKTNEYVVSKKLMEQAVLTYAVNGLDIIIARPFNHTGPGQLPGFLLPDLYEQVKHSQETGGPLQVGNLETKRDFTDVRDVAQAYVDLALEDRQNLRHTIYNICSGKSIRGTDLLQALAAACGIADLQTKIDPAKLRPNEIMDIYGSPERLMTDTGWRPSIPIEQTVRDFVAEKKS